MTVKIFSGIVIFLVRVHWASFQDIDILMFSLEFPEAALTKGETE